MTYLKLSLALSSALFAGTSLAQSLTCIDQDGDGWGWNGFESCIANPPSATDCIDTNPVNDGWGWNGIESCTIAPTELVCIDSPPTGDGWGWNGVESCRVTTEPDCIDSPPTGDGWGWNGITSCRISAADEDPTSTCIDSPPLGNGWGWNGSESCVVSQLQRIDLPEDRPTGTVITASNGATTAFRSYRSDFYAADNSSYSDVFTLNHNTGDIELITRGNDGSEADNHSMVNAIGADGRFILITSYATNLEGANTEGGSHVFLHDRNTRQHQLISTAANGGSAIGDSFGAMMSDDASVIAFTSTASDLVNGLQLGRAGVFIHNTTDGTNTLISDSSLNSVDLLDVSNNGRYILHKDIEYLFDSNGRQYLQHTLYVYDTVAMTNSIMFRRSDTPVHNGSISDDGQKIAFETATPGNRKRVLMYDRQRGFITNVDRIRIVGDDGVQQWVYPESVFPDISPDGKYIAFLTNDTTPQRQVYISDPDANITIQVSVAVSGEQVNGDSRQVEFTPDGKQLVFNSSASNLTDDDNDDNQDLFIYSLPR